MVDIQIIINIIFRLSECIYTFVAALINFFNFFFYNKD